MTKLELLAPAGSPEALTAAVRAGADAVYLGAPGFNARQSAHGFTDEELAAAVAYCHVRGVKVHLALNTLVKQDELPAALAAAARACALGVDALIVQDRGLARRIHAAAPQMPLHASTQLSCHTPAGVDALRDAGFSRVVLAREMSAAEIAACAGRGCELEIFVHGALCMAVSGQCYLSAMLGGRSGNRGWCAGPCRLPFHAADDPHPATDDYALSLRDLALARRFDELAALGVCSLKIEGRLKRPEYVAAATACYAALRDGKGPDQAALDRLQAVFSRSGFTDGYLAGERGSAMFGHRRREDVVAAEGVFKPLRALYARETPRVPLTMTLDATADEARLTVSDGERTVTTASATEPGDRPPLPPERVTQQLQKTGGTPFFVQSVTTTGAVGSVAALNALRRDALAALEQQRGAAAPIPFSENMPPIIERNYPPFFAADRPRLLLRLARRDQLTDEVKALADGWFLPPGDAAGGDAFGIEIPRGLFGTEEAARRALAAAREAGVRYALVGNVGALPLAREAGLTAVGSFGLNITNRDALAAYAAEGLAAATLSMELAFPEMAFAADSPIPTGLLLYGRQPLMLMRNCPRRAARGDRCDGCTPERGVTDRLGVTFPTACEDGCTELLNSAPLYWADRLREVPRCAFWLLHFTVESPDEVAATLRAYRRGGAPREGITRGLYRRGVE